MKLQIGGFCIKGGGHVWLYDEGPDGCSGWEVYIDIDPEDLYLFPEWIQELYRESVEDLPDGSAHLRADLLAEPNF